MHKYIWFINILRNSALAVAIFIIIFKVFIGICSGNVGGFWPPDIIPHPMPENPILDPGKPDQIS